MCDRKKPNERPSAHLAFCNDVYSSAARARAGHFSTCSTGTSTHSFIGRPPIGSNSFAPASPSASPCEGPLSLNTIPVPVYPANAFPYSFLSTGIPNIFPLLEGVDDTISEATASYSFSAFALIWFSSMHHTVHIHEPSLAPRVCTATTRGPRPAPDDIIVRMFHERNAL